MINSKAVTVAGGSVHLDAMLFSDGEPSGPFIVVAPGGIHAGSIDTVKWLAESLAHKGFSVLAFTWRDRSPEHDDKDIRLVIDWLVQHYQVKRIGLVGLSRGGMSALRTCADEPRIAAVTSFGSPCDMIQHLRGLAAYAPTRYALLSDWLGGPPDERRSFYEKIQSISFADRIKQPALLMHGDADMVAPVDHSKWLYSALVENGHTDVTLDILQGVGHFGERILGGNAHEEIASRMLTFLKKHVVS